MTSRLRPIDPVQADAGHFKTLDSATKHLPKSQMKSGA